MTTIHIARDGSLEYIEVPDDFRSDIFQRVESIPLTAKICTDPWPINALLRTFIKRGHMFDGRPVFMEEPARYSTERLELRDVFIRQRASRRDDVGRIDDSNRQQLTALLQSKCRQVVRELDRWHGEYYLPGEREDLLRQNLRSRAGRILAVCAA